MQPKTKALLNKKCIQHQCLILFLSLAVGHLVVMNNASQTLRLLLHSGYYYFSVCASAAIAYALINYVYVITKKIDREDGMVVITASRITKQVCLGLGGGILLEILLAGILYFTQGQNIFTNGFFHKLFAAIMLFIILVNVCYCFYFFYVRQKEVANQVVIVETVKTEVRYKIIEPQEVIVAVSIGLP